LEAVGGFTGGKPMDDHKADLSLAVCSQCGRSMGIGAELLGAGGEDAVCECCYAQNIYPDVKINCMELTDETRR